MKHKMYLNFSAVCLQSQKHFGFTLHKVEKLKVDVKHPAQFGC